MDLFDLADSLDGDPLAGTGFVDLVSGNVLPRGILDFGDVAEHFPELDEESDDYDPDRWLPYDPESSQGYREMQDFTASLTDGSLQDRLWRALDGRGAFRRFRDVLHDSREVHLQRWFVFHQECALGRARLFLAIEGYRAAPLREERPR